MIELRRVEPDVAVHRPIGALEAAEEIIKARMRTARGIRHLRFGWRFTSVICMALNSDDDEAG